MTEQADIERIAAGATWPMIPPWQECLPVLHHPCGLREVGYPGTPRHNPATCPGCSGYGDALRAHLEQPHAKD